MGERWQVDYESEGGERGGKVEASEMTKHEMGEVSHGKR